ncbi:uncharacterized protein LOC126699562 [Quercus robur]|uniref:uncharacterized protein LOC126699562 n=1 Tax=Quercus robur TaxID=38942 RepID=UPI002163F8E3|nr:uncharacterized protein LOC126699562 [Quercus robur]XP_050253420.1 uncharacterized protein LOC126699562 [Quercus robur]
MVHSMSLVSTGLIKFGSSPQTRVSCGKYGTFSLRYSPRLLRIQAVQENGGPRRLVDIIRVVPELSRNYFRSPSRRALFGGISLLGGFYVAQTISLSFGALGVNDVIAAVVCVLLTEYATKFYYSRPKFCCEAKSMLEHRKSGALFASMLSFGGQYRLSSTPTYFNMDCNVTRLFRKYGFYEYP